MLTIAVLLSLAAQAERPIPYYDPLGRKPTTYAEFAAEQTDAPFESRCVARVEGSDARLVLVFVNSYLYEGIQAELSTYLADLVADGFSAKLITAYGGRAQNLRQVLQAHRDSSLVGTVMVGDLPVAWWEWSSSGEDFPLDLFFTDLDGTFSDADADGMYDGHSGSRAPDIWLGRIYASRLTYDGEERLVRAFFQRNHLYRTGGLAVPRRGLVYNEVTWYPNNHGMANLYSDITMFNDANTTVAYHYKNQLGLGYEFVHLISHSSPWVHTFFLAGDVPGGGSVFGFELPALAPKASFYFLNACMCGRYTEQDNLGNWYLFAKPWSQAVVASAELMYGVSDISSIYSALGHDSCFGDAFLKWHKTNYSSFYGTGILGDPTVAMNRDAPRAARPPLFERVPDAEQDWTEYAVENSNFVNTRPAIGFSQGRVRVVFDSGRRVRSDNFISSFNGSTFSQPESIAWHEYYDMFSSCCTDAAGRFWVAWQSFRDYNSGLDHFQVFSSYLYNSSWSSLARVGPQAGYHDIQPALATGTDNRVWCAFKSWRNGQADVWVSYADNGGSWTTPVRLTTDSLDQVDPCVTVDHDNHPWVFWSSMSAGRWHIQGRTYDGTWQPAFELDTLGANVHPRAAVDGAGRVFVVWHRWQGDESDIYYSCRDGATWSPPATLCSDPADDQLPSIACAPDGTAWVVWQSRRNGPWDIYSSSFSGGWTEAARVTSDSADDYDPVVCADSSGRVWTAWSSNRRGYWNIYAASSPLTGMASERPGTAQPLFRAFPNPFGRQVTFFCPAGRAVDVFRADGRKVARVSAGATWSPRGLPGGIYFARAEADGRRYETKLVHSE